MTTTLPTLSGSEKQITWAEKIRAKQAGEINEKLTAIGNRIDRPEYTLPEGAEETRTMLDDAAATVLGETSASKWIERRDAHGMRLVMQLLCDGMDDDGVDVMRDRVRDLEDALDI